MKNKTSKVMIAVSLITAAAVYYLFSVKPTLSQNTDKFYNSENEQFINIDESLIGYYEVERLAVPQGGIDALYIDSYDRIYIGSGKAIFIVDTAGEHLRAIALDDTVRSITTNENGDIYIASKKRIAALDSAGIKKRSWDMEDERTLLTSLAAHGKNLFAADAGVKTVWRFDTSGTLLNRIGDRDTLRGIPGFVIPSPYLDIAIGQDGSLWAANPGRHSMQNFRVNGDLLSTWGESGARTEAFCGCCNPIHFTLLANGYFVTSEKGFSRVKVYNQAGEFLTVAAPPSSFRGPRAGLALAADSRGIIYVTDAYERAVRRFKRKENG